MAQKRVDERRGLVRAIRARCDGASSARPQIVNVLDLAITLSDTGMAGHAKHLTQYERSLADTRQDGSLIAGVNGVSPIHLETWDNVAEGEYAHAAELLHEGLALFRELGAKKDAVECLENLAAAGGAQGQATRAARLYGAAERLREVFEFPRQRLFRIDYERSMAALHTQLAEPTFTTTWMEGRAMALEQAIAYALSNREHRES
jgi:hypothetical protein